MALKNKDKIFSALDIGSTKITSAMGLLLEDGSLELLGMTVTPSRGLRNGVVVDLDIISDAIEACVEETEKAAQTRMRKTLVSINARGMKSFNSSGGVTLGQTRVAITDSHLQKCMDAGRNITLSQSLDPLHFIVRRCVVDNTLEVDNPIKMEGTRLEVELHILALPKTQITHFTKAVNNAGLSVKKLVLQPLAASEAVLTPEEKDFGALLLDIGACNTTTFIYQKGKLQHSFSVPVGGEHFTRDIVVGLRTTLTEAERVKCSHAVMDLHSIEPNETIEITGAGSGRKRQIARQILAEIIQPRAEEILEMVKTAIEMAGFNTTQFLSIVLSGGGAQLNQLVSYTEKFIDIPCRMGIPRIPKDWPAELATPPNAALMGLLLKSQLSQTRKDLPLNENTPSEPGWIYRTTARFKNWFQELV